MRLRYAYKIQCTGRQVGLSSKLIFYMNLAGELFLSTSGCLCTLGMRPKPMALRMAFAILRWFLGRSPVSLECFIRPISVMYSDIIVKFCIPSVGPFPSVSVSNPYLVFGYWVDTQEIKGILLGPLAAKLPLLLLGARQIVRGVDVSGLPLAEYLALELRSPLRLDHLVAQIGAIEAGLSGQARCKGSAA